MRYTVCGIVNTPSVVALRANDSISITYVPRHFGMT